MANHLDFLLVARHVVEVEVVTGKELVFAGKSAFYDQRRFRTITITYNSMTYEE